MHHKLRPCLATLDLARSCSIVRRPGHRLLTTSAVVQAGHNKWSKTKHIKAATDKKKMAERTAFTKVIAMYSKLYGEDVKFNPQLANAITAATKASVPKTLIEGAIARGQGRSTTGAQLEPMMLEVLLPPNVAVIVEAETDNKNRTLHDLKLVVKNSGGLSSSTGFYFTKRGRAVFKAPESGAPTLSQILDEALEHEGMEDVEELPDGDFLVWTEPAKLTAISEALGSKLSLEIVELDIVWDPNEDTSVDLESSETVESLDAMFSGLKEYPEVKAIFANVRQGSITDDEWDKVSRHLDV